METSEDNCSVDMFLSYQVDEAQWTPFYDVRVKTSDSNKFEINYFATVVQQTGEDWDDVELFLSTAKPRSGGYLPELVRMKYVKL